MANAPRFEVYPRRHMGSRRTAETVREDFAWRFRAANGQISAVSGEGFTRIEDAERAVDDFRRALLVTGAAASILRVDD